MITKFKKFKSFLGAEVWSLFIKSCAVGIAWFGIESTFIFVMQGFLKALGILNDQSVGMSRWYPNSVLGASFALVGFGAVRSSVFVVKDYLTGVTPHVFVRYQRTQIASYALTHGEDTSSFQILSLFNETLARASSVVQQSTQLIIAVTASVLFLVLGLRLAPYELLSGALLLVLFLYPLKVLNKKIDSYGKDIDGEWLKINETLVVSLRNYNLLKIYFLLGEKIALIKKSLYAYERHFRAFQFISSAKNAFPLFIGSAIIGFITFISQKYFHTSGLILLSFFYIFIRLSQGASEISVSFSNLRLNLPSFKNLYHWNELAKVQKYIPELDVTKLGLIEASVQKNGLHLKIENLSFGYDPAHPLFKNLNLSIQQGDCLVIQGPSGKGKSTLLTLILGLNTPNEGSIRINDFPVAEVAGSISSLIGYVGPEPFLIEGSFKQNLLYSHPRPEEVTDESCWAVLEQAQLKDLASAIGLNEPLNEMTPISTGQKQRLAIARALLRKPYLLILDEATANLDHQTEEKFIQSLSGLIERMTVIIITHKPIMDRLATQTLKL